MNRGTGALFAFVVLIVLFFAINVLSGASLRSARLDLTESKLFTLSEGSRNIARSLQDDVSLTYYFSKSQVADQPQVKGYGERVRELLEEYERVSGGRVSLEIVDPVPFSEEEDDAVANGLRSVPIRGGSSIFFGLVGTNSVDGREVIPYFDRRDEQFLEYELTKLIHTLATTDRQVVGVMSSLPIFGGQPNPMQPQPSQPWAIALELQELFDVRELAPTTTEIPADVDVLMVIHPKDLAEDVLYAIDQYVLGGGRAIVCVDPHCETDLPPDAGQNPMAAFQAKRDSNMPKLLESWGVQLKANAIAGDLKNAIMVQHMTQSGTPATTSYIVWIRLDEAYIDDEDAVTGRLSTITLAAAGILEPIDGAETAFSPLIRTSSEAMSVPVMDVKIVADPKKLLADFVSADESYVIGARVMGPVKTAFPERGDGVGGNPHLAESSDDANLIVLADVDMLYDRYWVEKQSFLGMQLRRQTSDNGSLITNAVENLVGSNDLISVRARGKFMRPFTRVEALRKAAEERYLSQEQELQEKLRETERKINELQRQKSGDDQLILSAEQQAEIDRFNAERVETRKELRDVRLSLNRDIERLGTKLKAINIALVPALLVLAAIGLSVFRAVRRSSDRRSVAQT